MFQTSDGLLLHSDSVPKHFNSFWPLALAVPVFATSVDGQTPPTKNKRKKTYI
jgi:hypothetical protein